MEDTVLLKFIQWANDQPEIRGAVLTSSRAGSQSEIDFLSDYDIEMYVNAIDRFEANDDWLSGLGEVLVRWPYKPKATLCKDWLTRLIYFKDKTRIDFQITSNVKAKPLFCDNGYTVLVDKDRLFEDLKPPTFQSYIVKKPDKERFTELVNEFWWNASYVPKYLWRNELPYAKHMMYCSVHSEFLHTIICWYIGLTNDWSVNPGVGGRHFRKYLDEQLWKEYESTFSDASIENSWKAFYNAVELFTKLAKIIAEQLLYDYPSELEHDMKQFFEYIRCKHGKEEI